MSSHLPTDEQVSAVRDRFGSIAKHLSEFVFPCVVNVGDGTLSANGISKRELFAAMAMQGFMASETPAEPFTANDIARRAVVVADALIVALGSAT